MPVTYRIEGDVVEMVFDGEIPLEDIFKTFHQMIDDPACPEKFRILLDVRKSVSLATRPTEEIIKVAEYVGPYKDRVIRCAVVAAADVHYGLGRMGAVYSEAKGVVTSVFRDREEAMTWLRTSDS
jgi:SpoIIAA-like